MPGGGKSKQNKTIRLRQLDLSKLNLDCRKLKGEIALDAADKKQHQQQKSKCSAPGDISSGIHEQWQITV